MNKNVLIVLAGGFVVALLMGLLVNAGLKGGKDGEGDSGNTIEILVAAKDLNIGHEMGTSDVKWAAWPSDAVFAGSIRREDGQEVDGLAEGRLNQSLTAGQPVLSAYLVTESKGNFMAATLGQGMRAVGVSVKADTMAGGFIGPGDYVDVILTYKVTVRDRDNPEVAATISSLASETILERVRVLAVDQNSKREEDKAKVARTVTLEVDAAGAEKLALGSEMGDITLSLRSLGDENFVADQNTTTDVRMSRIMKDVVEKETVSGGAAGIVRVYNGETIQNVPVRQSVQSAKE